MLALVASAAATIAAGALAIDARRAAVVARRADEPAPDDAWDDLAALTGRLPVAGLQRHPWRVACAAALAAGLAAALGHLAAEGPPADGAGDLVAVTAVLVGLEGAAVLGCFVLLGRFLGLRRAVGVVGAVVGATAPAAVVALAVIVALAVVIAGLVRPVVDVVDAVVVARGIVGAVAGHGRRCDAAEGDRGDGGCCGNGAAEGHGHRDLLGRGALCWAADCGRRGPGFHGT